MTKNQEHLYYEHKRATATRLEDVYDKCSSAKREAYANCWQAFCHDNGYDFKIIGHNTFTFSCGWLFMKNDEEWLHIETAKRSYEFCIE